MCCSKFYHGGNPWVERSEAQTTVVSNSMSRTHLARRAKMPRGDWRIGLVKLALLKPCCQLHGCFSKKASVTVATLSFALEEGRWTHEHRRLDAYQWHSKNLLRANVHKHLFWKQGMMVKPVWVGPQCCRIPTLLSGATLQNEPIKCTLCARPQDSIPTWHVKTRQKALPRCPSRTAGRWIILPAVTQKAPPKLAWKVADIHPFTKFHSARGAPSWSLITLRLDLVYGSHLPPGSTLWASCTVPAKQ